MPGIAVPLGMMSKLEFSCLRFAPRTAQLCNLTPVLTGKATIYKPVSIQCHKYPYHSRAPAHDLAAEVFVTKPA